MDYQTVLTTCTYCGCGCGINLEVLDGKIISALPSKTSPVNEGKLCIKGWNIHEFIQHPKRLRNPLMRKDGALRNATWEDALGFAASQLKRIRDEHGPDSVALLTSAKCTNEDNYVLQKFARAAIGTNNIDHCARL